jgi:hypothetical protein
MAFLRVSPAGYMRVSTDGLFKIDNRTPFDIDVGGDQSHHRRPTPRISTGMPHRADTVLLVGRRGLYGS